MVGIYIYLRRVQCEAVINGNTEPHTDKSSIDDTIEVHNLNVWFGEPNISTAVLQKANSQQHYLTDVGITLETKYRISKSNDYMFAYIINNPHICNGIKHIFYLVLVVTAPGNRWRRDAMRTTWARNDILKQYSSRTVYLLGNPYNAGLQSQIYTEATRYKDIIQTDFVDSYHNITLKVLSGIKWALTYCKNAKFIFRTNDDVFIDILVLMPFLEQKYSHARRSFIGKMLKKEIICRGKCKFAVSEKDFSGQMFFPPYLQGSLFIMTADILQDLYKTALMTRYFWIEDVFISGVVVHAMTGVQLIDVGHMYQYFELPFIKEYSKEKRNNKYFVTVTDTFYGVWVTFLSRLSASDLKKISSHTKLWQFARENN